MSIHINLIAGIMSLGIITGCIRTIEYASLEDHRDMMDECRAMCGEDRVRKYRPRSGECECVEREGSK